MKYYKKISGGDITCENGKTTVNINGKKTYYNEYISANIICVRHIRCSLVGIKEYNSVHTFISQAMHDMFMSSKILDYDKYKIKDMISRRDITALTIMEDEIKQCEQDGIENIVPYVIRFRKNPSELKQLIGSKTWKLLCKKTLSMNILLAKICGYELNSEINTSDAVQVLNDLSTIKRKFIPKGRYFYGKPIVYVAKEINEKTNTISSAVDVKYIWNIFVDTMDMKKQMNEYFNPKWSWKRMKKEHDEVSKKVTEENYKKYDVNREFFNQDFSYLPDNVKVINTIGGILKESTDMKHCISSYIEQCVNLEYMTLHISGDDDTTLGINLLPSASRADAKWFEDSFVISKDQHYGYNNAYPSNNDSYLADKVVKLLKNNLKKNTA